MANEIRLRANNISGTITDNPLTNVATTINSPGFVDLPTVTAVNHLILILDPLELAGAAEIVQVTAHSASASSVTVIRGFENSIARTHALGTTWFHGPVVSDYNYTDVGGTSLIRPTAPYAGQMVYETNFKQQAVYDGTAWQPRPVSPPACRVFNTIAQSVPHNIETTLTFDSERFDTDSMHSTSANTGRITFNTAGLYMITSQLGFAAANDYSVLVNRIRLNGATNIAATMIPQNTQVIENLYITATTLYKFSVADFVETRAYQFNAAAASRNTFPSLNATVEFSAIWVGVG